MKCFRQIALLLAGTLLLLHTFVPHHHHSQIDEITHVKSHQQANSLLDFIKLGFHLDMGSEHLEHFQTQVVYFDFDEFLIDLTEYPLICSVTGPTRRAAPNQQISDLTSHPFRGPPTQV